LPSSYGVDEKCKRMKGRIPAGVGDFRELSAFEREFCVHRAAANNTKVCIRSASLQDFKE
jgi:hypothetical protein